MLLFPIVYNWDQHVLVRKHYFTACFMIYKLKLVTMEELGQKLPEMIGQSKVDYAKVVLTTSLQLEVNNR